MATELKTKQTDANVDDFINAIEDEQMKRDCKTLAKMMKRVTGEKPKLWGNGTVGYDVDADVLEELVELTVACVKSTYSG